MGCFSFICKVTGEPANSSSFDGDAVHLFLLQDGKVIEHMYGRYDSYGRVFSDAENSDSFEWHMEWGKVCDLVFDDNPQNGIALIMGNCWKKGDPYPTERSEGDPEQGWGRIQDNELTQEPFHKIFMDE